MNSFDEMGGKRVLWGLLVVWVGLLYIAHSMETVRGAKSHDPHRMFPLGPPGGVKPEQKGSPPHSGEGEGAVGPPHYQPTSLDG